MKTEDKIDRYLMHKMSEKEIQAFEELISNDPSLEREVNATRHIMNAIERKEEGDAVEAFRNIPSEEHLRKIITKAENPYSWKPEKKSIFKNVYLYVAAATVAVLIYGLLPRYSMTFLYEKYDVPEDYVYLSSREGIDLPFGRHADYEKACMFYQLADYPNAISQFEYTFSGLSLEEVPEDGQFYYAVSLLKSERTDDALGRLNILVNQDGQYKDDALWQMALIYLLKEDRKMAIEILVSLSKEEGYYREKSLDLLKDLKCKKWFLN